MNLVTPTRWSSSTRSLLYLSEENGLIFGMEAYVQIISILFVKIELRRTWGVSLDLLKQHQQNIYDYLFFNNQNVYRVGKYALAEAWNPVNWYVKKDRRKISQMGDLGCSE